MDFSLYQSRIEKLLKQRNFGMMVNIGLFGLCFLLGLSVLGSQGKQRIIVVPANLDSDVWLDHHHVSPSYLVQMSQFYTLLRFNITPHNAEKQHQVLLRHVDPANYGSVNAQLSEELDRIKKHHISTVFYPVDTKINAQKFIAEIHGELVSTVGKETLPTKRVSYQIHYKYHHGRLLIKDFEEVSHEN